MWCGVGLCESQTDDRRTEKEEAAKGYEAGPDSVRDKACER